MESVHEWIKFIHVLAGFTFMLAHGASVAAAYRLKSETKIERIQAVLDTSSQLWIVFMVSWLVLLVAGIINGFLDKLWDTGWIWTSLVILIAMSGWMSVYTVRKYHPLRKAVGSEYTEKGKNMPAEKPASAKEIAAIIDDTNPGLLMIAGYGGTVVILWLMMFKPF